MELRSPFGVTKLMKTVIFMKLTKYRHENPGGAQELRTVKILMKAMVFEVVPRGHREVLGFQLLART